MSHVSAHQRYRHTVAPTPSLLPPSAASSRGPKSTKAGAAPARSQLASSDRKPSGSLTGWGRNMHKMAWGLSSSNSNPNAASNAQRNGSGNANGNSNGNGNGTNGGSTRQPPPPHFQSESAWDQRAPAPGGGCRHAPGMPHNEQCTWPDRQLSEMLWNQMPNRIPDAGGPHHGGNHHDGGSGGGGMQLGQILDLDLTAGAPSHALPPESMDAPRFQDPGQGFQDSTLATSLQGNSSFSREPSGASPAAQSDARAAQGEDTRPWSDNNHDNNNGLAFDDGTGRRSNGSGGGARESDGMRGDGGFGSQIDQQPEQQHQHQPDMQQQQQQQPETQQPDMQQQQQRRDASMERGEPYCDERLGDETDDCDAEAQQPPAGSKPPDTGLKLESRQLAISSLSLHGVEDSGVEAAGHDAARGQRQGRKSRILSAHQLASSLDERMGGGSGLANGGGNFAMPGNGSASKQLSENGMRLIVKQACALELDAGRVMRAALRLLRTEGWRAKADPILRAQTKWVGQRGLLSASCS